nr:hypothetical protein [Solirubrobacterales bacterium]
MGDDQRISRGMERQLGRRAERLRAGERSVGWKLGFGTSQAMEKLGISQPLVGFLTDAGRVEPGATVSLDGIENPKLEPEIALHLGSDLESGEDPAVVRAAVASVGPAFELVDLDASAENVEEILAADIFHRRIVSGPGADPDRLEGLRGELVGPGGERTEVADPAELTGPPLALLAHVADLLAAQGERLRAGELVI